MKKTLRADEIIAILEAPLDLSWRRRKDRDFSVFSDPSKHFHPRTVRLEREASVRELLCALEAAPTPRSRYVIIGVLGRLRAKSAVPTIVRYLGNRSWRVRNESADALMHICDADDRKVGGVLLERLDTKERKVSLHSTLAVALGIVRYRPAIPALIRTLNSENEVVRRCAAGALCDLGAMEAIEPLRRAIDIEQVPSTKVTLVKCLDQILKAVESPETPNESLVEEGLI